MKCCITDVFLRKTQGVVSVLLPFGIHLAFALLSTKVSIVDCLERKDGILSGSNRSCLSKLCHYFFWHPQENTMAAFGG